MLARTSILMTRQDMIGELQRVNNTINETVFRHNRMISEPFKWVNKKTKQDPPEKQSTDKEQVAQSDKKKT